MSCCNSSCNHDPCGSSFNQLLTKAGQYAQYTQSQAVAAKESEEAAEAAQAAAEAAAAQVEGFESLYLGAKDLPPAVDNEGNPLQEGALYFNTVILKMYVWDGTNWSNVTIFNEATDFLATGSTEPRNLQDRFADIVNVKDFGAVGDGVTDDTAAIQAALAFKKNVFFPEGTYNVSGTLTVSKNGAYIVGSGTFSTIITSSSTSLPIFSINSGLSGATIMSMQLTRSVTATTGGDGIKTTGGSISKALLRDLLIRNQNNGLALGPTDWSEVDKVTCEKNQNVGFYVINSPSLGSCQWSFDTCLSQMNGAQGFLMETQPGPPQMTTGTFKNCATFANSGVGIGFVGSSSVPLQGVRILGGFFGEDGNHEIYLDTYGDQHHIEGVFVELAGRANTGPNLSTPPSNIGCGITVTSNNGGVQLTGVHANGNSQDGYFLSSTSNFLGNCRATNNGQAVIAGRRNGVYSTSGRVIIMGGRYGNTAGVSQQYAAFVDDGNNLSIGFSDLTGNSTSAWGATNNITYVTSSGNLPNTLNVGLSPQGTVLIGGGAVGGFTAQGTMNVESGLLKNNIGYTNP